MAYSLARSCRMVHDAQPFKTKLSLAKQGALTVFLLGTRWLQLGDL